MAAPNKQPAGSRPGPSAPHEHAPHKGGKPDSGGRNPKLGAVAPHGAPKPVGKNKGNPLH